MAEQDPNPKPLDYAKPDPPEVSSAARTGSIIIGFAGGSVVTIAASCAGASALANLSIKGHWTFVALMFAASIACWAKLFRGVAAGRNHYFLVGLLIGAGVVCLLQGICFTALT